MEPVAELRLAGQDPADVLEYASAFRAEHGLRIASPTVRERGFLLLAGDGLRERRARAPRLPENIPLEDMIGVVLRECLDQFTANWPVMRSREKREAVHQMRVALRRLRAALALFNRALPIPQFRYFRAEAKRIASAMGAARDMDAFIALVEEGPLGVHARDASFDALLARASAEREAGYELALATISAPDASRFALDLSAFVARRGWRNGLDAEGLSGLSGPGLEFARRALARLDRRALKRGKKLAELSAEDKHEARIAMKDLRYATEFFGSLFPAAKAKKYNRAAARLQDALGAYNDAVVSVDIAAGLEERAGPTASRAAGVVIGWCGRGGRDCAGALSPAWKAFRKAGRFW